MDGIRSGQHSSLNADYIYARVVLTRWHRIRFSPRRRCYIHTLDVFRLEKSGSFLWIGSAGSMQEARELIKSRAANPSEEFLILNEQTQEKLTVRVDGGAVSSKEP